MIQRTISKCKTMKNDREEYIRIFFWVLLLSAIALIFISDPVLATATNDAMQNIITSVVDNVISPIFTGIGILLAFYSVGSLMLAFKNDDPDSKSRASMTLIVAIALVGFPAFVSKLGLLKYLK